MATYKVIQDIEAEDKLLGPLSLRQFIYAIIVVVMGFTAFKLAASQWYLALPLLPPMILFAVLAAPFGHDQPSEVWLLAKIRFSLKPRIRIWDQSGANQLVTITAPKRPDKHYTNGLTPTEVRSRLKALADTIDSRGWAVKNVNVNMYAQPGYGAVVTSTDRLVDASSLPQEVPSIDVTASDDIMAGDNPVAAQLDQMMAASAQAHRQQALKNMQDGGKPTPASSGQANDYWFLHQHDATELPGPGYATFGSQTVTPGATANSRSQNGRLSPEEQALLDKLHAEKDQEHILPAVNYGHMKVINPLGQAQPEAPEPVPVPAQEPSVQQQAVTATQTQPHDQPDPYTPSAAAQPTQPDDPSQIQPPAPMTQQTDPAILGLANNDDLNVATIAREADRTARKKQPPADEVVISLR